MRLEQSAGNGVDEAQTSSDEKEFGKPVSASNFCIHVYRPMVRDLQRTLAFSSAAAVAKAMTPRNTPGRHASGSDSVGVGATRRAITW